MTALNKPSGLNCPRNCGDFKDPPFTPSSRTAPKHCAAPSRVLLRRTQDALKLLVNPGESQPVEMHRALSCEPSFNKRGLGPSGLNPRKPRCSGSLPSTLAREEARFGFRSSAPLGRHRKEGLTPSFWAESLRSFPFQVAFGSGGLAFCLWHRG